jgi:hypothetical protein
MYLGKGTVNQDAMIFVSGATVDGKKVMQAPVDS